MSDKPWPQLFGRHKDGTWTMDTGQSGAGYRLGLWYGPGKTVWRLSVEIEADRETWVKTGDWKFCHNLLNVLKDVIGGRRRPFATVREILEDANFEQPPNLEAYVGKPNFGLFA